MAKVKNGKLHGTVGKTVNRVFRGQEIVQSYPRTLPPRGQTPIENSLFGECAKMNGAIYRLIKDFALKGLDYDFSWETMALLKRNFFQRKTPSVGPDWISVGAAENLAINKKVSIEEVLNEVPLIDFNGEKVSVLIPAHKEIEKHELMKNTVSMEYSISLIHYNIHLKMAEVAHVLNSGRNYLTEGLPEKIYEFSLVDDERSIRDGLVILCFGLRFFESSISYGYMNSLKFNPTAILGMWWKDTKG